MIAVDSVGSVQSQGAAASLTFSHTCTSASLLTVCVGLAGPLAISAVAYNGDSLTQGISNSSPSASDGQSEIWYLLNPDSGANNVVITWDFALDGRKKALAISWTGVNQTAPVGSGTGTGSGATGSLDGTSSSLSVSGAVGEVILDCMVLGTSSGEAPTVGSGQTQRASSFSSTLGFGVSTENGAETVSMDWSWSTSTCRRQTALQIKPFSNGWETQGEASTTWASGQGSTGTWVMEGEATVL